MSEPQQTLQSVRLDTLAEIDPEALRVGTSLRYKFKYVDISCASNGKLTLPSDFIDFANAPSRARKILKDGDLLVSTVRPNLKAFAYCRLADEPYIASTGFAVLRARANVDAYFLLSALLSDDLSKQIESHAVGSNYPAINSSDIRRLQIPAFEPKTQRAIGKVLACVDTAIEQTEALIEKYQHIKAGLMHDLFTRGVLPNGQLRPPREQAPELYQETAIGWIPREWELGLIGGYFDIQLGKMLNQLAKTGRNSHRYMGNRSVQWNRLDLDGLELMDFSPDEQKKFALKNGDLLVCEGGEVGRTAIWESQMENCFYQKAIHRLRSKVGRIKPRFMLWYMHFAQSNGQFADFTSQSSIAHLTQEKLAKVPTFAPTKQEQELIIFRIDAQELVVEGQRKYLANLRSQKLGLMQDLLTGKVSVAPIAAQGIATP